jgi:hypothetical protein
MTLQITGTRSIIFGRINLRIRGLRSSSGEDFGGDGDKLFLFFACAQSSKPRTCLRLTPRASRYSFPSIFERPRNASAILYH